MGPTASGPAVVPAATQNNAAYDIQKAGLTLKLAEETMWQAGQLFTTAVEQGLAAGMTPGQIQRQAELEGLGAWAVQYVRNIIHDQVAVHARHE
jgi:hypothetical protein